MSVGAHIIVRKDRQIHFVKTPKTNMQAKYERFSKTALVVRRIISKQGMVASIEIDVKSALLKEVLLDIYKDTEGMKLHKTPPIVRPPIPSTLLQTPNMMKRWGHILIHSFITTHRLHRNNYSSPCPAYRSG